MPLCSRRRALLAVVLNATFSASLAANGRERVAADSSARTDAGEDAVSCDGTSCTVALSTDVTLVGVKSGGAAQFLGIKFASSERLEASQLFQYAPGTYDALTFGPRCPQIGWPTVDSSEDCLTLNVWTPVLQRKTPARFKGRGRAKGLAVIVYIPGGAFVVGGAKVPLSSNPADPTLSAISGQVLAEKEGAVVVSLQYRLGLLGRTGSNLNIGDLLTGLAWIQQRVGRFGGDSNKVTISGHSAGATAALWLSSLPGPLPFRRAAALSPTAAAPISTDATLAVCEGLLNSIVQQGQTQYLFCPNLPAACASSLEDCLKSFSVAEVLAVQACALIVLTSAQAPPGCSPIQLFAPAEIASDDAKLKPASTFTIRSLADATERTALLPTVPLLVGGSLGDGTVVTTPFIAEPYLAANPTATLVELGTYVLSVTLGALSPSFVPAVSEAYCGNADVATAGCSKCSGSPDPAGLCEILVANEIQTDSVFVCAAQLLAGAQAGKGYRAPPTYLYSFEEASDVYSDLVVGAERNCEIVSPVSTFEPVVLPSPCHSEVELYVFNTPEATALMTPGEKLTGAATAGLVARLATTRYATSFWPRFKYGERFKLQTALGQGDTPIKYSRAGSDKCALWLSLWTP